MYRPSALRKLPGSHTVLAIQKLELGVPVVKVLFPVAQSVHALASSVLVNLPTGHAVHCLPAAFNFASPSCSVAVAANSPEEHLTTFATQSVASVEPGAEVFPFSHLWQLLSLFRLTSSMYVLRGQFRQALSPDCPLRILNFPAGQETHALVSVLPGGIYSPAGHAAAQVVAPTVA
jgi:hypothetical protein